MWMGIAVTACALLLAAQAAGARKTARAENSALDRFIREASALPAPPVEAAPNSLYRSDGRLADGARDLRAGEVNDIVTIVVAERATALAKGTTNSARKSASKYSAGSLYGAMKAGSRITDLARLSGESDLQGQGQTSRQTTLSTTLSARVTHALPNGLLVIEGAKDVQVNSERQQVTVRGVIRPSDLGPANRVSSDRIAQMELRINGRGVVGDAIRRPFFLYRLLLGLLPF